MVSNPKPNQRVRIHYRAAMRSMMFLHGMSGVVAVVGKGRPRNHLVEISGRNYVIPAGNLVSA
jgi:hypothetical protein